MRKHTTCERPTSLAGQHHESLRQAAARRQLAAASTQISQEHAFGIVKVAATAQQKPAQRLWTRQDAADGWWRLRGGNDSVPLLFSLKATA